MGSADHACRFVSEEHGAAISGNYAKRDAMGGGDERIANGAPFGRVSPRLGNCYNIGRMDLMRRDNGGLRDKRVRRCFTGCRDIRRIALASIAILMRASAGLEEAVRDAF
jgi:hypothetical protein